MKILVHYQTNQSRKASIIFSMRYLTVFALLPFSLNTVRSAAKKFETFLARVILASWYTQD